MRKDDVLVFLMLTILSLLIGSSPFAASQRRERSDRAVQSEEALDYFRKWLTEDVVYIITAEEKTIFENLTTDQEREQFIEQFWFRRDPDTRTPTNEFKEEHYRRIAYANEMFFSAKPGWQTDRGRIYIIHGEPAEIESHPTGGPYDRPLHEGGGTTVTYPFEIWRYRQIDGIGSDIEIEFVDPTMTGEYRIASRAEEKDAFLFVPGYGATDAEEIGLATKNDRPFFSPANRGQYPLMSQRWQDSLFQRYETMIHLQRPKQLKYNDLKELVSVDVSFDNPLPFSTRNDYFRLTEEQVLVPITLELENRHLTFRDEGGRHRARVGIYGIVTSISNRIVMEFEDDLFSDFAADSLEKGRLGKSLYQRIVPLGHRERYRLDLVVKDLNSGKIGVVRKAVVPPSFADQALTASALVLSDFIQPLEDVSKENEMFVLGDVWIRPSVSRTFSVGAILGLYLQLYNAGVDQTSFRPDLEVRYAIRQDTRTVFEQVDDTGMFIQYYSEQRVVLICLIPLVDLEPGTYEAEVAVRDRIGRGEVVVNDSFQVVKSPQIDPN